MSKILGMNGLPVDAGPPPVLAPGQQSMLVSIGETPAGVALVIAIGGHSTVIPMAPGQAAQFGAALIGAEAVWQAKQRPKVADAEDGEPA